MTIKSVKEQLKRKDDLAQENIDGVSSLISTPNTLTYTVPDYSELVSPYESPKIENLQAFFRRKTIL